MLLPPALCLKQWPQRNSFNGLNMWKSLGSSSRLYWDVPITPSWVPIMCNGVFMSECVYSSLRQMRIFHKLSTSYSLIFNNQAFHSLDVHRTDCNGLWATLGCNVIHGCTAFFKRFAPFKYFTVRVSSLYWASSLLEFHHNSWFVFNVSYILYKTKTFMYQITYNKNQ